MDFDLKKLIDPSFIAVVAACYFVGIMLKATPKVKDWCIPYLLTALGVVLCMIPRLTELTADIGMSIYDGIVQGILCSGMSVYVNQLYRQGTRR